MFYLSFILFIKDTKMVLGCQGLCLARFFPPGLLWRFGPLSEDFLVPLPVEGRGGQQLLLQTLPGASGDVRGHNQG